MKFSIILVLAEKSNEDGFPLYARVSHGQARPKKNVGRAWPAHFSTTAQMVTDEHPYYDVLAPKLMDLILKAKKIILKGGSVDPEEVLAKIMGSDNIEVTFGQYYKVLLSQMEALAESYKNQGEVKLYNKISGNIDVYKNAITQFQATVRDMPLAELDHAALLKFKNYQLGLGNKKATVSLYLRTVKAVYNKGVMYYKLHDKKPFKGLFSGLVTKSYNSKKKYLDIASVRQLENLDLLPSLRQAVDLFLLQFYLGGCDLKDVYYLEKKQIRRGRVYFERGKTDTGFMIDLKLHPKALDIIKKYPSADEWQFPWRKDKPGYKTFLRRHGRALIKVQELQADKAEAEHNEALKIEVLPMGDNLAVKVARHTFANIGKLLDVNEALLGELQGHIVDKTPNFYKDRYPEAVRDAALFKIIG